MLAHVPECRTRPLQSAPVLVRGRMPASPFCLVVCYPPQNLEVADEEFAAMKSFFVEWPCWTLHPPLLTGGVEHNGRGETCHSPGANTNRVTQWGSTVVIWCPRRDGTVWAMSTGGASDRVVHRRVRPGFLMFPGLPSVCKGWNAVRVPRRALCFRRSEAFWLFGVDKG